MIKNSEQQIDNTAGSKILLLAVVVLLAQAFSSCIHKTNKELQTVEAQQEMASFGAKDLHTVVTDSGFYKYEFETPQLSQYDNVEVPYIDFPVGLKFKMYGNKGKMIKTKIRCNNAKYYKDDALWELNNDVEAVTEKNDILNTEQLFWNTKEHRIYSDKFVKITTKNQIITGYGFESDEKLSKYEIKHPGGEIEVDND